ncbi:hypothetical protein C5167_023239 [Papaver somniferum]|uniref:Uncharacterized protein n=1 Tax=Papaver somniferum TaxID=3469 RepID=A0A4Y7JLQ1_PAPSO|nr:hypothetical protein C5167_023239 [Papaver somniferum]
MATMARVELELLVLIGDEKKNGSSLWRNRLLWLDILKMDKLTSVVDCWMLDQLGRKYMEDLELTVEQGMTEMSDENQSSCRVCNGDLRLRLTAARGKMVTASLDGDVNRTEKNGGWPWTLGRDFFVGDFDDFGDLLRPGFDAWDTIKKVHFSILARFPSVFKKRLRNSLYREA